VVTGDSVGTPFVGRTLPPAAFAGDDGRADARLASSLARWAADPTVESEVVAALASARVFVAVVAVADEDAHVAVLTVTGVDGRRALPVFTSPEALTWWRSDARPVPVPGRRAALSAVAEGCDLLDLDPAGPVPYMVRRPAVWSVGRGLTWIPSYADPLVAQEISTLSAGEGLESRAEPGGNAELRVVLGVPNGLGVDEVRLIVGRFELALSRSERIAESVDSLEVVVRSLGQRPHHPDD
jgi:hypothetical protein